MNVRTKTEGGWTEIKKIIIGVATCDENSEFLKLDLCGSSYPRDRMECDTYLPNWKGHGLIFDFLLGTSLLSVIQGGGAKIGAEFC